MKLRFYLIIVIFIMLLSGCNSQFISSGIIYMQQNDLDKATQQFQMAIDNEPNNPQAYFWMGKAYGEKKEFDKASSYFLQALDKDTSDRVLKEMKGNYEFFWAVIFNAGVQFKKNKDAKDNFAHYETLLKTAEEVKDTFLNYDYLVLLYSEVGNESKMLESYNKSLKEYPDNVTVVFNVAKYYIKNTEYSKAKDYLEKAMKIDESNPYINFYLASINHEMGKTDKALEEYKKIEKLYIKMDDDKKSKYKNIYKESINSIANIYMNKKNYKKAIIFYDKTYQIDNEDMDALRQLAIAYYLAKNFSKAIDTLDKYTKEGGAEMSQLYLIKSDCLNRIGKKKKALEIYKKYEELKKQGK